MIADIVDVLRCPTCHGSYALTDRTLRCPAGHSVDLARQGHVNLLGHAAPAHADTPEMVQHRIDFLSAGHYGLIDAALTHAVADAETILEAGAGPAYHLAQVIDAQRARGLHARGIATDISPAACRRAARHTGIGAVVADTWAGLPVADASCDAVLCVFAPRNLDDFARVLAPGGVLVVVTPTPEHLAEVRAAYDLLDVPGDKLTALDQGVTEQGFALTARETLTVPLSLDAAAVEHVVMMGPNAFHTTTAPVWEDIDTRCSVTVSVFAR